MDPAPKSPPSLTVFVDADACPARDDILLVCKRHGLKPVYVSNQEIRAIANDHHAIMQVVTGEFDAADNWLVENAQEGDLLLTADLLLAQRAVKKKIEVMNFSGNCWTDEVIHDLVARREIQQYLREMNMPSHNPAAYTKQNRSRLKASLHEWIETRKRRHAR